MWTLVRRFGQVSVPASPKVMELVSRLSAPPRMPLDIPPPVQERVEILKDLQEAAQLKMRDLNNDQLYNLLRSYALTGQGSSDLFNRAGLFAMKRLHSFKPEQLAAMCYYFVKAQTVPQRFLRSVEHAFMKDIRLYSPLAVAQLTYALSGSGSDAFFRTAVEVFKANIDAFSSEAGLMLLTGLERKKWSDSSLPNAVIDWTRNISGGQYLLVQVYHVLLKLQMPEVALEAVEQKFLIQDLSLRSAEQLLGCGVTYNRHLPTLEILSHILTLLSKDDVDVPALAKLIYTLKSVPEHSKVLPAIHAFLQKNAILMTPSEVALVGSALLETKDEVENTKRILSALFTSVTFPSDDILRLLLAAGRQKSGVESLMQQVVEGLSGHMYGPSEFVLLTTLLARLNVTDQTVWKAVLKEVAQVTLQDAEQYMQVYTTLASVPGIEASETLAKLASTYEE